MKRLATTLGVAATTLLPLTAQTDPFTHEANGFLFSRGDFNSDTRDDIVVVDQTAATIRIATQEANGTFTWSEASPSGIELPEALSVGRFFQNTRDGIALGSTTANRVHLFDITSPTQAFTPTAVFPPAPGPSSLATFNIDNTGTADLVAIGEGLAPLLNKGPGRVYQSLVALNTSATSTWSLSFPQITRRVNPVRPKPGSAPRIAEIYGTAANLYLENVGPAGLSGAINGGTIPPDSRYSIGSLDATTLTHILSWVPDSPVLRCQRLNEPSAGTFAFAAAITHTLPAGIRFAAVVQQGASARIAVLHSDATLRFYQFNGSTAPVPLSTHPVSNPDLILPIGGTDLLVATGLRTATPQWLRLSPDGGNYTTPHSGTIPPASPAALTSNILFLSAEPFVTENVQPKALRHFREWTTTATPTGGVNWTVQSLAFTDPLSGLASPQNTSTTSTASTDFPLLSQYSPALSVHSLDSRTGTQLTDIVFDPPPGLYNTPPAPATVPNTQPPPPPLAVVTVNVAATAPGFTLRYRTSPTADYTTVPEDGLIPLFATTTLHVYGENAGVRTPLRTATYTIATPPALTVPTSTDANANGLPDAFEQAFNLTDPLADPDQDGYTNLDEFLGGGDPHIFGYLKNLPPKISGELVATRFGKVFRLEWPLADDVSELEFSTTLGTWDPVTIPPTPAGNKNRVDVPFNPATPRQFFRLHR
jgi:hypothetical protein